MDAKRNPLMMECVSTAALSLRLIRVIGFIMRLIAGDCVTLSIVPGACLCVPIAINDVHCAFQTICERCGLLASTPILQGGVMGVK